MRKECAYVSKILQKASTYAVGRFYIFCGQVSILKKRSQERMRCSEILNDYVDPRLNPSICTTYVSFCWIAIVILWLVCMIRNATGSDTKFPMLWPSIPSTHIKIHLSSPQSNHHNLCTYWSRLSLWCCHATLAFGRSLILGEETRIILQLFLHNVKPANQFAFEVQLWERGPIGLPDVSYDFEVSLFVTYPNLQPLSDLLICKYALNN